MASELVEKVLNYVGERGEVNSLELVGIIDNDHQKIIGAIKSLQTLPDVSYRKRINDFSILLFHLDNIILLFY